MYYIGKAKNKVEEIWYTHTQMEMMFWDWHTPAKTMATRAPPTAVKYCGSLSLLLFVCFLEFFCRLLWNEGNRISGGVYNLVKEGSDKVGKGSTKTGNEKIFHGRR